jgi:hypothetical protein
MSDPSRDELLFLQVVAMFQFAAMQQMGKLPSPVTGKIERDLAQAKVSIDIVEMLQKKTADRCSAGEKEYLDKVLFELRMNYVDEVNRPAEADASPPQPPAGHSHDGADEGAS